MLGKILSKEKCAECKFCCSFRRQSLWESPFPISATYKTDDGEEEIPCDYLDSNTGCTLSENEKPFDCKIWPFRVMQDEDGTYITITLSCPALAEKSEDEILDFANSELLQIIQKRVQNGVQTIHPVKKGYKKLIKLSQSN